MEITIKYDTGIGSVELRSAEKITFPDLVYMLEAAKHVIIHQAGMIPDVGPFKNDKPFTVIERKLIGPDGLCTCSCGDRCPLGKTGSERRCTKEELIAAGVPVITNEGKIEKNTTTPDGE